MAEYKMHGTGPVKVLGSSALPMPKEAPQGISAKGKSVKVEKGSATVKAESKGTTKSSGKLSSDKSKKAK